MERVFEVGLIQHGELFLAFEAILGWGGGGASIRHGAFIRGERLIQTVHLREGVYQIQGVYLRVGVYKIIYGISKTKTKTKIMRHCF